MANLIHHLPFVALLTGTKLNQQTAGERVATYKAAKQGGFDLSPHIRAVVWFAGVTMSLAVVYALARGLTGFALQPVKELEYSLQLRYETAFFITAL